MADVPAGSGVPAGQGGELLAYVVPGNAAEISVRDLLLRRLGFSRTLVRRLKREGQVLVNGEPVYLRQSVAAGDQVRVLLLSAGSEKVTPQPLPLTLVYEDRDVLVVDKPPGLVVHPTKDYASGTLANAVAHHLVSQGLTPHVHLVSRLDRDTSGLLLLAKHPYAGWRLSEQIMLRRIRREYLALVHGQPEGDAGVIDRPIARDPEHSTRRRIDPAGQRARTRWRVLRRWPAAAFLALALETGRTHQIRVHLSHLGHPLLGDELYGAPPGWLERQALHAHRLAFCHPVSGRPLAFTSPLPADMAGAALLLGPAPG